MARKQLNKEQRRYIRLNYKTMSLADIAKQLKCDTRDVQDALREMELLDAEPVHKALPLRKVHKIDFLWGIPCFLIPTFVYAMTMCRTLYVGDSGEFSAQGTVLGIAHPPGYPMWILLLKCAVTLFQPWISSLFTHEAARGAFLCAIVAGLATFFLYILLLKLSHYRTIAIMGSLLFAFCYHFWSQALFSEVFILNVFFTVVTMLLMLLWSETQEPRYFLAFYFVTAMAMAHHNLFLVMPLLYSYFIVCTLFPKWDVKKEFIYLIAYGIVGLILYFIAEQLAGWFSMMLINEPLPPGDTFATKFTLTFLTFVPYTLAFYWWHKRDRIVIYAALLFILGFGMYIYLPMRILSNPNMSWGSPHTVYDLYNHISRRQYGPLSPIPRKWPFGIESATNPLGRLSILGPWDIVKEQFAEYWIDFFRQFGSFWDHYAPGSVLAHFNHQLQPPEGFPHGGKLWLMGLWTFTWVILLFLGIWRLLRQNGKYFMLSLMAFLFYGPGMLAVLNYQTTNHSMYIIARFLIPSYLMASIWIAFGVLQVMEWFKFGFQITGLPPIPDIPSSELPSSNGQKTTLPPSTPERESKYPIALRYAGCALILAMPIVPLKMNFWHQNLSKNQVAYDFGLNILNSMTPDGKIFIIGDNPTFALAYLCYVEHKFPADQVYDEGENLFVMIHDFGKAKFSTSPDEHQRLKDIGRAEVTMTSKTPVYYMSVQNPAPPANDPDRYKDYPDYPKIQQVPSGIVYRVLRPGEAPPDYDATLSKMIDLDPFFYNMSTDYYTRELVSNYHFLLGRAFYQLYQQSTDSAKRAQYKDKAFYQFRKVSETGWDLDNMHINLAMMYRQEAGYDSREKRDALANEENQEALEEYKKSLETQPRKALVYFQMADLLRSLGKTDEAIEKLKKGVTLGIYDTDANDPSAYYMLGSLELEKASKILNNRQEKDLTDVERTQREQLISDAINYLNMCISLSPTSVQGYQALGEAYYFRGQLDDAVGMWQRAVQINPNFYPALMNLFFYYRDKVHDPQKVQEYYTRAMQAAAASGVNPQSLFPQQPVVVPPKKK